ncbi:hypothetical protein [Chroococcidiopsis sp.]
MKKGSREQGAHEQGEESRGAGEQGSRGTITVNRQPTTNSKKIV